MLFAFFIAIVVICALMVASLAIHMRIRSGELRPVVRHYQTSKLHNVIFADETEDERMALPLS
jgi:hypothetical protein